MRFMPAQNPAAVPTYSRSLSWGIGLAGIIVLSPDALLLRLAQTDYFVIAVLRALFSALALSLAIFLLPALRRGFLWKPVCIYGACYALGLMCFPLSIKYTYTANTLVIISIAPLLAAIGAYWVLGERTRPVTLVAAAVIFVGLVIIFSANIGGAGWVGDLLALLVAISLAATSITVRRYASIAIYPGLVVGCLLVVILMSGFADWRQVSARDVGILAVNGVLVISLAFALILTAARGLPPAELNLIFLLETLLGPFWVWLVLEEVPPLATVAAGVLIAAVLACHALWLLKKPPGRR